MQKLNVIFEDNHIIVVEKIPNIPSQGDETTDISMIEIIKEYLKEKYSKPGEVYLGLIHRLDRPVGGVMVYAKTSKAASRLSEQVRNKFFEKEYLAIVNGKPEKSSDVLENYLYKDERNNISKVVEETKKDAKYAKLEYELIKYNKEIDLSVLKVKLYTGRHHQIRVQLSNINHSIYGDQKYGTRGKGKQIALWAYSLKIYHPITKEQIEFISKPENNGSWKILYD